MIERPIGVENIPVSDVKAALWASQGLGWLSFQDHTVAAISNLRTLAWVIQAATVFEVGSAELSSPAAIADRIWEFWTEGKPACQSLLIRLAVRDGEFERSFALSELDAADAEIFQNKPAYLPLRKNNRNRIEFQHDLAADWARFQRLKELSDDIERWAAFASNPLWSGALRLFGQFLLREPAEAGSEWDHAFSAMEKKGEKYAADVLLDALCLDPRAEQFLEDRSELLFANGGELLKRLLRRFLHIATVPSAPREVGGLDRALALYVEAKYRMPIYGFWPPLAGFLHAHLQQGADLVSPTVAEVCEVWLTTTPPQLQDGIPLPFRREFAEVALAAARSLQVEQGKGTIYAATASAPSTQQRLPVGGTSQTRLQAGLWKWRNDVLNPKRWRARLRPRRRRRTPSAKSGCSSIPSFARISRSLKNADPPFRIRSQGRRRNLPAWPMGPKNSVEPDFRQVVLHTQALAPLMKLRPELAAEILLAALIEGNPTEEYSETMRLREGRAGIRRSRQLSDRVLEEPILPLPPNLARCRTDNADTARELRHRALGVPMEPRR